MDLHGTMPTARVGWADLAKAISILLLVFWTIAGDDLYLNEMLIFVRMPLFFFVSGLFAYRVITRPDLGTFLRDKIGALVYLYALWVGLLFAATDVALYVVNGRPVDLGRQLTIFWDPELNIWFLYALAVAFLLARLLRDVPVSVVLAASLALYLVSAASGEWRHLAFLERIVRLFPFFWIGLVAMPAVTRLVERYNRFWLPMTALFLALAWAVFDSALAAFGPLTFAITLIGIAAMLLLARRLADAPWSWPLAIVGASTLFIYVMHKIVLFYMDWVLGSFGVDFPGLALVKVAVIVAFCVVVGRWAQRTPWAAWLFVAPWTRRGAGAQRLASA